MATATLTTLVNFNGTDGANSQGGLMVDAEGDLFGATYQGGAYRGGDVFEIAKTSAGYATTPTVLASFGSYPIGGLIADAAGDLFGTTQYGGAYGSPYGDGTVFEIAKTSDGYASTPTVLASFDGADGHAPVAGLIADAAGDLFGTTSCGRGR